MKTDEKTPARPRVGGQAIIEGVMMRSPHRISAAVRLPDGAVKQRIWQSEAWYTRSKFLGWPVVRGAVSLAEALVLGVRTLNWSADAALEYEKGKAAKKKSLKDSVGMALSIGIALLLALTLFMWAPYQIATALKTDLNQPLFHLVAGATRIAFFLVYLWLISLSRDIRRVFQYHGAEHQAIFAYEKDEELLEENARRQSRFHPRCGTSFILIVALATMLLFVLFDFLIVSFWGPYPSALLRLLVHLPFLPLVAGISYEFLRLSERLGGSRLFGLLIRPGLALQKITTQPPDDSQREIALMALKAALPEAPAKPQDLPDYDPQRAAV